MPVLWKVCKKTSVDFVAFFVFRSKYERPLGIMERWYYALKGMGSPIVNGLGITSSVPLTPTIINETLKHLMRMHTLLRACIRKNENGVLSFYKLPTETLNIIETEVREEADWENVVYLSQKKGDKFYFENGPLWKCIFLPNATINNDSDENLLKYNSALIFFQDHAINDGVGTVLMMKNFMFILNQLLAGKKMETDLSPPVLPLEYFLNQKFPMNIMKKSLIIFFQTLLSFELITSCVIWVRNKFTTNIFFQRLGLEGERNPQCEKATRCHVEIMKAKETKRLVQACRSNGCTVQGIIQAASNKALVDILLAHGVKGLVSLNTFVPVNLRRRMRDFTKQYQASTYAKGLVMSYKIENDSLQLNSKCLWSLARKFSEAVHANVENNRYLEPLLHIKCVVLILERFFNRVKKISRKANDVSLLVSTLGRFSISESNTIFAKPTGFPFSVITTRYGPVFTTYAATLDDQMSITHSYYPHVTSEYIAREYFSKFKAILELLTKDMM